MVGDEDALPLRVILRPAGATQHLNTEGAYVWSARYGTESAAIYWGSILTELQNIGVPKFRITCVELQN